MATLISVPTKNFTQKTLDAQLLAGVTASATLNNTTGIQNLPGVFVVDRINTNDVETPNKREVIKYTATSGSTVTTLTRNADNSGSDQDHEVGAICEFVPDVLWAQSIYDVITTEHNTDGTHGAITATNATLTTPKIVTSINDSNGNEVIKTPATSSAVNEITVTNAATGTGPTISATGGDTNIPLYLKGKGSSNIQVSDGNDNELLKFVTTSSAVNELTVTNAATGNAPSVSATGGDTNINLNLVSKGTGVVQANGNTIPTVATAWTAFTPTFSGSGGSAGTYAQDLVSARYTTIGKLVYFTVYVRITNKGSWSGNVQLAFPVTAGSNISDKTYFPIFWTAQGSNPVTATRGMAQSGTTSLIYFKDSINTSVLQWGTVANNDTIFGQGFYEID